MANANKVILIGNLTRDPELRHTPRGTAVADIGIATSRQFMTDDGENEEVTFVDITLWDRTAETAEQFLSKGDPVYIEGRLKLETWEDKKTGDPRSKMVVVGERMQMLGAAKGSGSDGGGGGGDNRRASNSSPKRGNHSNRSRDRSYA